MTWITIYLTVSDHRGFSHSGTPTGSSPETFPKRTTEGNRSGTGVRHIFTASGPRDRKHPGEQRSSRRLLNSHDVGAGRRVWCLIVGAVTGRGYASDTGRATEDLVRSSNEQAGRAHAFRARTTSRKSRGGRLPRRIRVQLRCSHGGHVGQSRRADGSGGASAGHPGQHHRRKRRLQGELRDGVVAFSEPDSHWEKDQPSA